MAWVSGAAPYRVVGVLPRGFLLPTARLATDRYDGIVALNSDAPRTAQRGAHLVAPFARLRPGVSIEVAQARIDALVASAFQDEPWGGARGHERKVIVQPLQNGMSVVVGPYLWLVVGAVWAVLGVSCFSLSTLLLTWGQARQRDAGIRLALGASPPRLLAAAFLESCAICLAGASLAWLGYVWGRAALIEVVPPALRPFAVEPGDPRVVVATIAVATLVACIAGAVPALRAYRADVLTVLRPTPTASRLTRLRGTAGLVSLQSAFGIVLVVGAATTVPAFVRLLVQSPGFEVADLHLVNVRHNWSSSESAELLSTPEGISRVRAVLATMAAVPGVTGVAATTASTLTTGNAGSSEFWRERGVRGHDTAISGEFFQTLGVAMWAGRAFEDSEALAAAPVAVLNETGAQSIWPGRDPAETVGLTISTADGVRTVVGIVADFRSHPAVPIAPELFIPISATEVGSGGTSLEVIVRASPGQRPGRRLIEERLNATFPRNTVQISSVADAILPERIQPRFLAVLFGSLAAVTLVLVAAGLYGLADYEIGQRRREMSIRLALGATARDLRRRILALVVAPVLVGTLAGGFVSWWAGSIAGTMLPHVDANDPRTYAAGLSSCLVWPCQRHCSRPGDCLG
jgi:predicted permease